jgi:hypothetical protein
VALALQADGWHLRGDVIWAKPNPMPEPVLDRPTRSHEYVFLLTKRRRYFYDAGAIAEQALSNHQSGNHFLRPHRLSWAIAATSPSGMMSAANATGAPYGYFRASPPPMRTTPLSRPSSLSSASLPGHAGATWCSIRRNHLDHRCR